MSDEYATLRAAFHAGAKIQAWHLNEGATTSADGRWDDLSCETEPTFGCPVHLYRIAPDDAALIAEIGQDVGAVADGELSEIVEDMRTCARWYEGTYAANRVAHWANRLACIQSANRLSSLDRYLESGAVQEDANRPLLAARETADDGAAIMGRLARALAKADPLSKLPRMAIDWLRGQGIHWKSHCPTDPAHDFGEPTSPAHTSEARDAGLLDALRKIYEWEPYEAMSYGARRLAAQALNDYDAAMRQEGGAP